MSDTTKAGFIFVILIAAFLAIVFALFLIANTVRTEKFRNSDPVLVGDCLLFPSNWQPVAALTSGDYYLCQNSDTNEYRKCVPQYVTCEGE